MFLLSSMFTKERASLSTADSSDVDEEQNAISDDKYGLELLNSGTDPAVE